MRKFILIISLCMLASVLSLKAQGLSGIRINGGSTPILVYFGGNQMCLPTTSCFVTNLRQGYYTVEVFATRLDTRPGERVWKGQKLYHERVYFGGSGVKDVFLEDDYADDYDRVPGGEEDYRPGYGGRYAVMDPGLFETFFRQVQNEIFPSDRLKMIEAAVATSSFTSGQCLRLVKLYSFDDDKVRVMKMVYPRIVDKEAFFTVISTLTFSSAKEDMTSFVRQYGRR